MYLKGIVLSRIYTLVLLYFSHDVNLGVYLCLLNTYSKLSDGYLKLSVLFEVENDKILSCLAAKVKRQSNQAN